MKQPARIVLPETDRRLAEAAALSEARKLCKRAGVSFREWVASNTRHSYYTAVRLARIGDKRDPHARLMEIRSRAAAANRRCRARKRIAVLEEKLTPIGRCKTAFARLDKREKSVFITWATNERDQEK